MLQGLGQVPCVRDPVGRVQLHKWKLHSGRTSCASRLAAISQYFQITITLPATPPAGEAEFARAMRVQAPFLFPVVIFIAALSSPAALGLYWTALNAFGILQEIIVKKFKKP